MSNYDEKYIFHFLTKLSEEELYPFFSNKYASLKDNDKKILFSSFINETCAHKLPKMKNRYTSLSSFVIETLEKDFDLFKPLFDKSHHLWLKLAYSFVFNSKLPVEIKDIMLKNNALSHFKMIEFIKTLDPFYINTNQELFSILIENKQLHPNQIKHMFFKELSRDIYGSYDFLEMFIKITGNEKSFILNDLFDYTLSSEISIKNRILNKYLTSEYIINNQEKIISLLIKDDISFFNKNKFVKNIISTLAINTDKIVFKMLYASMSIKYFEKLITNEPLIFKKQNIIELQNTYPNFYQHFYLNNKIFALSKKQHLYSLFSSSIIKSEFSENNINKSLLIKNRL